jgi:hypothetical protein
MLNQNSVVLDRATGITTKKYKETKQIISSRYLYRCETEDCEFRNKSVRAKIEAAISFCRTISLQLRLITINTLQMQQRSEVVLNLNEPFAGFIKSGNFDDGRE